MKRLRFTDIENKPARLLALTSLSLEDFRALVEPFEKAFLSHMGRWRFDGKPRTRRAYATYRNCPLPTAEDRLLFVLVYLKLNPLQEAQGAMFGIPQSKANPWLHMLMRVLREAMVSLGDAPSRSLVDLAKRLDLTPEQAEQILAAYGQGGNHSDSPSSEVDDQTTSSSGGPLFVMTEPRGESSVPKTRMNKNSTTAVRKSATR